MIYKCFTCGASVMVQDIKYHTADRTKIFCGASCSLAYYQELKEKKNGE